MRHRSTLLLVILFAAVLFPVVGRADEAIAIYKARCSSCHRIGGGPNGARLRLRDLTSDDVRKLSDAQLTSIIASGKGKMPGFAETLNAAEISSLVKYIRSLK